MCLKKMSLLLVLVMVLAGTVFSQQNSALQGRPGSTAVKQPIYGVSDYKSILDEDNMYIIMLPGENNQTILPTLENYVMEFLNYYDVDLDLAVNQMGLFYNNFSRFGNYMLTIVDSKGTNIARISIMAIGKRPPVGITYIFFK